MKNLNPIILIDDDEDDLLLLKDATNSLGLKNEILVFSDPGLALRYFTEVKPTPFFTLCDINMPKMDGFELRKSIHDDRSLVLRTTPFIFLTTAKIPNHVNMAYTMNIQGYFIKPTSFSGYTDLLGNIVSYWNVSVLPFLKEVDAKQM